MSEYNQGYYEALQKCADKLISYLGVVNTSKDVKEVRQCFASFVEEIIELVTDKEREVKTNGLE